MSKKAKDLLKAELEKNKEIQRYGATSLEATDVDTKELDLQFQQVDTKALAKMVKFK